MPDKPQVEQIFYSHWGKQKPEHKNYFSDIEAIAEWIAWGLEAQQSGWSDKPNQMSTIAVTQHKEKYGTVRVYCTLAASSKIKPLWRAELRLWSKMDPATRGPRPDKKDFDRRCLISDLRWFRSVYKKALYCWPQYETAIRSSAEWSIVLGTSADVNSAVRQRLLTKRESDTYLHVVPDPEEMHE